MTNIPLYAPIVGATIDWLSVSCNRPLSIAAFLSWRDATFERLQEGGYELRSWGTHGWQGHQAGSVRFASSRGNIIVQVSGGEAERNWYDLVMASTNVSRIDLATTVRPLSDASSTARDGFDVAKGLPARIGRPISYSLIQTTSSSDTLYVGKGSSDSYGRVYDKGAESGDPLLAGLWRYEVEYKRKVADAKARALLKAKEVPQIIAGDVYRWFNARGITPCYRPGAVESMSETPKVEPDDERKLRWLRSSVQPLAKKLTSRYGWRYVAEACVGRITSHADWESLVRDVEIELQEGE